MWWKDASSAPSQGRGCEDWVVTSSLNAVLPTNEECYLLGQCILGFEREEIQTCFKRPF